MNRKVHVRFLEGGDRVTCSPYSTISLYPNVVIFNIQMSLSWKAVSVFVSSTFNDMHAERDYLVKRVFPELREWCEHRKLRLIDIDLRWGITEADSKNKNVVKVCLNRIDDCRPFFLCFLGQRRGWVPDKEDIAPDTCAAFPVLKNHIGAASVTEMEILHAVINPMNTRERADRAFFYLREPSYLKDLPKETKFLLNTYTNEGIAGFTDRQKAEDELHAWREETIPGIGRPVHHYTAQWDPNETTSELAIPLQCPSLEIRNQERWKNQWRELGIDPLSLDLSDGESSAREAIAKNEAITRGRLGSFRCEGNNLAIVILGDLKTAIAEQFPEHMQIKIGTPLQKELDQQEQFLELNCSGFIRREGDFDSLNAYIANGSRDLFVLTAPGGMGKTMLLANWIRLYQQQYGYERPLFYRFIGASDGSITVDAVIRSLLEEIKESGLLPEEIPTDPTELIHKLAELLASIGARARIVVVIDALNQLESGLEDLHWLPMKLPNNVQMIISFKEDEDAKTFASQLRESLPETCHHLQPFESRDDRKRLVKSYLDNFLKQLDDALLEELIDSPGAKNPLFLKIVLSELRIYGSFPNLGEKIRRDFGTTPIEAFGAVLQRLENDPAFTPVPQKTTVPLLFGLLSHARVGLSEDELVSLFLKETPHNSIDISDAIRLCLRQVRPFLAMRDGRHDFFYDSFRLSAANRYANDTSPVKPLIRRDKDWHGILATFFRQQADPGRRQLWRHDSRPLQELPYHLSHGELNTELREIFSQLAYLSARVATGQIYEQIADYSLSGFPLEPDLVPWYDFLRKHAQRLTRHPGMLVALANHEGFPEAREQAANVVWRLPWLRTALEPMPTVLERNQGGLQAQVMGQLEFHRPRVSVIAPLRDLIFCLERLGNISVFDARTMRQTDAILTIRRDRPLVFSCALDASSLAIFFESGKADLYRCIFGQGDLPTRLEPMAEFDFHLPECEDPIVTYQDGVFWYQANPGALASISVEEPEVHEEMLPGGHKGELSALVFNGDTRLIGLRQGLDSVLLVPGNLPVLRQSAHIGSACSCGLGKVAVSFTDGFITVFGISGVFSARSEIRSGMLRGVLGWDGSRLLWLKEQGGINSCRPEDTVPVSVRDNQEVFPDQLHILPKQWISQPDGSMLVGTSHNVVSFRVGQGGGGNEGRLEDLFGGRIWRSVRKRGNDQWLLERHPLHEILIGKDVKGRLYCTTDGIGRFFAASGSGTGVVFDASRLSPVRITGSPLGLNAAVGDDGGGCWFADRAGEIFFTDASGNCHGAATIRLPELHGSRLLNCDEYLVWSGYSSKFFPETGPEPARTLVFFRKVRKEPPLLEQVGEQFRHPREGLCLALCYNISVQQLVTLWAKEAGGNGTYTLKIAPVQEFINWNFKEIIVQGLGPFRFSHASLSADGRFLGILNMSGEISCISLDNGLVHATLGASNPFTAIAPGAEGPEFLLVEAYTRIYKVRLLEEQ